MATDYDLIVIGGGPNGLTTAAYLAKAGAKVLLVERRHECGGGLLTEDFGGFRFNLHAFYMMLGEHMLPVRDLNLHQYGVMFRTPEVQVSMPLRGGRALVLYRDLQQSVKSVERFSPGDGPRYEKMWREFHKLTAYAIIPATYALTAPVLDMTEGLQKTELGRRLLDISEQSPREILDSYGFRSEELRALLLFLGCVWGVPPDEGGLGYLFPLFVTRMTQCALAQGSSHRVASGIWRSFVAAGGDVMDDCEVARIVREDGRAAGVELTDGRVFKARAVASSVDLHQTFFRFIGADGIPRELADAVRSWRWEGHSLFGVHLALRKPPEYKAGPDVGRAFTVAMGFESVSELMEGWTSAHAGRADVKEFHVSVPTLFDPSQAPAGHHVARLETSAPYDPGGGPERWDGLKDGLARRALERWEEYAPGLDGSDLLRVVPYTPLDISRKLIDMVRGSIKQGSYTPTQMGYFRPNDLCSRHRTPIPGLYLNGASVYPGGMVTLGPGYNAAGVIAQDLGVKPWWSPPRFVTEAREKGLVPG